MIKINIKNYLVTLCLLFSVAPLFAAVMPIRPFEATYTVKYHGISAARGKRSLKIYKKGRYHFITETRSTVPFMSIKIVESSDGVWTSFGPRPDEYSYHQSGLPKKRNISSRFDWKTHQNYTQKNEQNYKTEIPDQTHDRISYQLALREDLIKGKKEFVYHLADKNRVKDYIFKQIAKETLTTPAGKFETVKMQRTNGKAKNGTVIFWLAPKYDYIPIKIIGIEKGKVSAEANLKTYKILG